MMALSVRQPWAWLIAHGHKAIENRTRRPPKDQFGERIAIHASASMTKRELEGARAFVRIFDPGLAAAIPNSPDLGVIVATAKIVGLVQEGFSSEEQAVVDGLITDDEMEFFVGPVGWVLRDVERVRPAAAKGALGLWQVPSEIVLSPERS